MSVYVPRKRRGRSAAAQLAAEVRTFRRAKKVEKARTAGEPDPRSKLGRVSDHVGLVTGQRPMGAHLAGKWAGKRAGRKESRGHASR